MLSNDELFFQYSAECDYDWTAEGSKATIIQGFKSNDNKQCKTRVPIS
ncbi:MAG: hypothetical protein PHV32_12280 [Eubacteriales bacterium]|nr:hypothetical protein [Eubacteriales bacterium]